MQHSSFHPASTILQARKVFLNQGVLLEGIVADAIARSWQRCRANGLDADASNDQLVLDSLQLKQKQEQSRLLLEHAQSEMEMLNEQIAHKQNVVVLTDAQGVVVHRICGLSTLTRQQQNLFMPGIAWHEDLAGTNAIGIALHERRPISVRGGEHFMSRHHAFSCVAAPLFNEQNEVIAVLDVSDHSRMPLHDALALVKMSAQAIENRLFCAQKSDITLHFHVRPEFVGTLWEGIAKFNRDGQLLAMNRRAQAHLNVNPAQLAPHQAPVLFEHLFDTAFSGMAQQLDKTGHLLFPLRLHNGNCICARIASTHTSLKATLQHASPPAKTPHHRGLEALDSGDAQIAQAIEQIKRVVARDIPILIQGETGVGKELLARAIHEAGPRRTGPWVAMNCAAIPEGLIEAELFGYEEGAFTGAKRKGSQGKIEQAHGGTLFLDEIGDMPWPLQARLLRVLQERSITPLGGNASKTVDFNLVAASNQNLRVQADSGAFRSDLYYRINGLTVTLPPLRMRRDLDALIDKLLQQEGAGHILLAPEVKAIFHKHPWPGNVRQLHNVLKTALALTDDSTLTLSHLTQDFLEQLPNPSLNEQKPQQIVVESATPFSPSASLSSITHESIRQAMQLHAGNISAVSRQLGISRKTLYRKLKALNLL